MARVKHGASHRGAQAGELARQSRVGKSVHGRRNGAPNKSFHPTRASVLLINLISGDAT
jgi:hypothetical protein